MWYIFKFIISLVWIMDIFNFGCTHQLDTTYPINFWMWLFIWFVINELDEQIKDRYSNKYRYKYKNEN
ncbi:hypothetical protein KD33_07770 [Clostridium sp. NCR]|nr:hypothetical protein KD33_07770 [Clostridium sp. NCR]